MLATVLLRSCWRGLVLAACFLTGCGSTQPWPSEILPPSVPNGWQRAERAVQAAEASPDVVRRLGLKRAERAAYRGPVSMQVTAYEMTSKAGAFECVQTVRSPAQGLSLQVEELFVVVEAGSAERAALAVFADGLEKSLRALRR